MCSATGNDLWAVCTMTKPPLRVHSSPTPKYHNTDDDMNHKAQMPDLFSTIWHKTE